MEVNELLDEAIKELSNLEVGEIIFVRELFKGYEWNRIERSTRLLLGTLFLNKVKTDYKKEIIPLDKTVSGQKKYKIVYYLRLRGYLFPLKRNLFLVTSPEKKWTEDQILSLYYWEVLAKMGKDLW